MWRFIMLMIFYLWVLCKYLFQFYIHVYPVNMNMKMMVYSFNYQNRINQHHCFDEHSINWEQNHYTYTLDLESSANNSISNCLTLSCAVRSSVLRLYQLSLVSCIARIAVAVLFNGQPQSFVRWDSNHVTAFWYDSPTSDASCVDDAGPIETEEERLFSLVFFLNVGFSDESSQVYHLDAEIIVL